MYFAVRSRCIYLCLSALGSYRGLSHSIIIRVIYIGIKIIYSLLIEILISKTSYNDLYNISKLY